MTAGGVQNLIFPILNFIIKYDANKKANTKINLTQRQLNDLYSERPFRTVVLHTVFYTFTVEYISMHLSTNKNECT